MKRLFAFLLTAAVLPWLTACGTAAAVSGAETESKAVSAVQTAEATVEPTDAPTPAPPLTPTPTAEPTAVPENASGLPDTWDALQQRLYDTDCYCAAAYLGRSGGTLSEVLPSLLSESGLDGLSYLTDIGEAQCVSHSGDEVYLIIPRGDQRLAVYNYVLETKNMYDAYAGALLYSADDAAVLAVRCNESDVRANLLCVFTSGDKENEYSPRISLRDGTLLSAAGVYTLASPVPNTQ